MRRLTPWYLAVISEPTRRVSHTVVVGADPISIAMELAAGRAVESITRGIAAAIRRRECRIDLAKHLWSAVVGASAERFRSEQGFFDPTKLWAWVTSDDVSAALLTADPNTIRAHGTTLRATWRSSTYDATNVLTDEDGELAAELVYHLLVLDVLAGDQLLVTVASRLLDAIENLHNDLALVCVTLASSTPDPTAAVVRRLALSSERTMEIADRGLSDMGEGSTVIHRGDAERALEDSIEHCPANSILLLTGQPDVGKSHLAMVVARRMHEDRDVFAFNLREHGDSIVSFESALGGDLRDALARSTGVPLVVIDGAEVAQTAGPDLLLAIVERSLGAGCRTVLVSRSDAEMDLSHSLASRGIPMRTHVVGGFTSDELAQVQNEIPIARELVAVRTGSWLAERPGLLKAWLTLRPTVPVQNEGHLVEMLRNQRIAFAGPGKAARIAAAAGLALAELGDHSQRADPSAIDQLRSAGVLAKRLSSWETTSPFSDDLWRDAALAGLIADEPTVLVRLSGIRSALRAAMVACQLRINAETTAIADLVHSFDQVSETTGHARWGDIPFEALSSLGGSRARWAEILRQLRECDALGRFLATARRTPQSLLHRAPLTMSGFIDALLDGYTDDDEAGGVIRAWLEAGAVQAPKVPDAARKRVCAFLVASPPKHPYDDHEWQPWLSDLALCAVDLSLDAASILRASALERPTRLDEVFRNSYAGFALAHTHDELLIELSESYYVVREGWSIEALRAPYRGLGAARFGALHTPIAFLLQTNPLEGLALAARILNKACRPQHDPYGDDAVDEPERTRLDLPGQAAVDLFGGPESWSWYRGGLAAPTSAVNILLALERFADQLVVSGGTVDRVTDLLLRTAPSLPMVGLCVGLSTRHLDVESPSDAFLCWIRQRLVWDLEIVRTVHEQAFAGFVSTNEVCNEERRSIRFGDIAARLSATAVFREDAALMSRLEQAASSLETSGNCDPYVDMWAAALRPSRVRIEATPDGIEYSIDTPQEILDALNRLQDEIAAEDEPDRLAMRYQFRPGLNTPLDHLPEDLAECSADRYSSAEYLAARTNTAAAALRAAFDHEIVLPADALNWAVSCVLEYLDLADQNVDDRRSMWGPPQAVAAVLPVLHQAYAAGSGPVGLDDQRSEVRRIALRFAQVGGAEIVWTLLAGSPSHWTTDCAATDQAECANAIVAELIGAVLDRSVKGATPRRARGRTSQTSQSSTRYIEPSLLVAPLALAAHRSQICDHINLDEALDKALALHAEAFADDEEGSRTPWTDGNHFSRVGGVLMDVAREGNVERVARYIRELPATAQSQALQGMRQVAGDDAQSRPRLAAVWPALMAELAGDLSHDDRWVDAHSELVPNVKVDPYSMNSGDAWNEATAAWINPRSVEAELATWAADAKGCGKCAGALGSFMLSSDPPWVRSTGLPMLAELVASVEVSRLHDREAAWLADLPNDGRLARELAGDGNLLAIIDRYVQADDYHALVARQKMDHH